MVTENGMLETPPVTLMIASKFSEISVLIYCDWVNSTLTTTHCYYKIDIHLVLLTIIINNSHICSVPYSINNRTTKSTRHY